MRHLDKLPHVARILLGLVFTVFGLNGQFTPVPEMAPEAGDRDVRWALAPR